MDFENWYRRNPDFPHRYIPPTTLENFLQKNLSDYNRVIGTSYAGKNIRMLTLGSGPVRVIAWSQMHGNESNATHALLDLWESLQYRPDLRDQLFSEITLDFILMLNPDGSEVWNRRNAQDIDLNRDFLKLESKELPILKEAVRTGNYHYGLNLHEQRTIFTTDGVHPATFSFLSPSVSPERELTETRKKGMAVIARIYEKLNLYIPHQTGRYTDEFYPASTGDNFSRMGLPVILYEGGHFPEDYERKHTRKYYTLALYEGLKAMAQLRGSTSGFGGYFEIPENQETHYDFIYRNVKLNTGFDCVLDVAVQYKEELLPGNEEITFTPVVVAAGDVGDKKGWKEMDCTGKKFICDSEFPKLDHVVNFRIE